MILKRVTLLLILGVFSVSVVVDAQEYVTDGLVAFYTLDEDDIEDDIVIDVVGGNDATIRGTLAPIDGRIDEALEFDGAGNYVEIPPLGDFEQLSVECWALGGQFGGIQGIVSTWQWAPGKVHFKFESGQIQVHKNDGQKIRFNAEEDRWYHIVYTTDTLLNELKLYVDGELVDQGVAGGTLENMNERRIGSEHNGRYLVGIVDEVRIYDRVLEEDEVIENFEVESNDSEPEPEPIVFKRGDSDANGTVNITDAVYTLSHLFTGGPAPGCPDAADADDDGSLAITDAVFELNWLFGSGTIPPAPGPEACGSDPSPDLLVCESSQPCA